MNYGNIEHGVFDKMVAFCKGQQWKKSRTFLNPIFTTSKMKTMYPVVSECGKYLVDLVPELANEHGDCDVRAVFARYTFAANTRCSFGVQAKGEHMNEIIRLRRMILPKLANVICATNLPKLINDLIGVKCIFDDKPLDGLIDICRDMVDKRKANEDYGKVKHDDFLQQILESQNNPNGYKYEDDNGKSQGQKLSALTDDEVIAQVLTFFMWNSETTIATLTYAAQELANHPEVQHRLYEELTSAVGADGNFDYDVLSRLPYLDSVISETLRLHPPTNRLLRSCTQDCKLDGTDIAIDKGLNVEISVHLIHHSEEYWPNAYHFLPERFMPENRSSIKPYSYLPFGAGPRSCIAMRFAQIMTKLGLAFMVLNYQLTETSEECPVQLKNNPWVNSPESLFVGIKAR